MGLVQNFTVATSSPNQLALNWLQPIGFNTSSSDIIITRTQSHFPMELYNSSFPNTPTDPRGIEIFEGSTIVGLNPSSVSVTGNILTDSDANFTSNLIGRLLRDSNSQVFKIINNTTNTLTLNGSPAVGIYVILCDFPTETQIQQNFEVSILTTVAVATLTNPVMLINNSLQIVNYNLDQLVNMIFIDGSGSKFIVQGNTANVITFFGSNTPIIGPGMAILPSFFNSEPSPYIDNFLNSVQAENLEGTGLLDNTFYYYTAFTLVYNADVAQAEFGNYTSGISTQDSAISTAETKLGNLLYSYWPIFFQQLDTTADLEDLMQIFGFQFDEIHALIESFTLQDPYKVYVNALLPLAEQYSLPPIGYSLGADTLRRIAKDMMTAWKLKGSKEGIALFIRILTTWDITNGTGDFSSSISDFLPNTSALRFFSASLGNTNTRLTNTNPFTAGGRFVKPLPGIIIPGFFTFREFVVNLPNVALYIGTSQQFTTSSNATMMVDSSNNFGSDNSLVDNYLLPNQEEINDIYLITSNTSTTITVEGIISDLNPGGTYAVLSPLNANRFTILNKLLPVYQPFGTQAGFNFINS